MDETLYEILKTMEDDRSARRDSIFFAKFAEKRVTLMAPPVIARLRAIVAENHLSEDALEGVWNMLGLARQ